MLRAVCATITTTTTTTMLLLLLLLQNVRRFLSEQPQALRRILTLLFQLVMGGNFSTYAISRPLLGLILLFEQDFLALKEQMIRQQVDDKRQK